jgi:hypothetical protein
VQFLASIFVGKPFNILLVAVAFLLGHVALQAAGRTSRGWLVVASAWGIYGGWEWLVNARSPDANIRVDLLLIWPVLGILTAWYTVKALR